MRGDEDAALVEREDAVERRQPIIVARGSWGQMTTCVTAIDQARPSDIVDRIVRFVRSIRVFLCGRRSDRTPRPQ